MPYSDGSLRPWILNRILRVRANDALPFQVVDVGAGAGLNLDFIKPFIPRSHWTAVEIWEPYVAEFGLEEKYDKVVVADAREHSALPPADLFILGDVLEHMKPDEAIELWQACRRIGSWVVASVPIVHWPQGAEHGNPYEEHVYHWGADEFFSAFPGITDLATSDLVGGFWADGIPA